MGWVGGWSGQVGLGEHPGVPLEWGGVCGGQGWHGLHAEARWYPLQEGAEPGCTGGWEVWEPH